MEQDEQMQRLTEQVENLMLQVKALKAETENYSVNHVDTNNNFNPEGEGDTMYEEYVEPVCWRCGQRGHIKKGCMVRLDHSRRQAAAIGFHKIIRWILMHIGHMILGSTGEHT